MFRTLGCFPTVAMTKIGHPSRPIRTEKTGDPAMKVAAPLVALIKDERDAVLPFFDAYAQLGNAYDDFRRIQRGTEFDELWIALGNLADSPDLGEKLQELKAARAWLIHMVQAFSEERAAGKWPELLKHEAAAAMQRIDAAIAELE